MKLFSNWNNLSKKNKFKLLFGSLILTFIAIFFILFHFWEYPLVSPLSDNPVFKFLTTESILSTNKNEDDNQKIVYGFLPYWGLNQVKIQPELTHLSYFGLNINEDGTILTKDAEGKLHPGYARLDSDRLMELVNQVYETDNKFEITLVQFEADKIVKIANSEEAHENLIKSLNSILLAYPVSGINIDIEYGGTVTAELRDNFASLVEKISTHVKTKFGDDIQISIDMFASASDNRQIWDVPRIARSVDYIVVMAYDFHRTVSPRAGPVAPLFGNQNYDEYIHHHLHNYLRYAPKEKILLGIPFYGYEWQVDSHSPRANSYPDTGRAATYQRVKKLLADNSINVRTGWDEKALCPYLSYEKDGDIFMIYYENATSVEYKLEYVRQLDLAGIAIWALGYEGDSRSLWDVIAKL